MKRIRYILSVILIFFLFVISVQAQSVNEGKALFQEGKYAEAMVAFEKAIKASPGNASYNYWYGTCLLETGQPEQAKLYLQSAASKKVQEAYSSLGKMHYLLYEFEESVQAYTQYRDALIKNKKAVEAEEISPLIQRSERAARILLHCENIQIIDSLIIDKERFLETYLLSAESGSLERSGEEIIYLNPLKDKRYFAGKAREGHRRLYSEIKLQEHWADKKELGLSEDSLADHNYPFVLQDGMTLYFASTGDHSIGGYDLFITRYNLSNDSYLAPNQMGMPFNSIANDYMLAIDEINNIGYFTTDRFQPEGKVIVYTFIPNEEIVSINANSQEELRNRAKITSIKDSWQTGNDYRAYIEAARKSIAEEKVKAKRDFYFVINDNMIYYTLDEFENDASKQAFLQACRLEESIRRTEMELKEGRNEYLLANDSKKQTMQSSILSKERLLEELYPQLEEVKKNARNLEIKYLRNKQ